jgi:hypothetical protein
MIPPPTGTAATGTINTMNTTATSNNSNWRNRSTGTRNNNRRNAPRATPTTTSSFKGSVTEMHGHVFQCYGESPEKNQFTRTMEEIDAYVGLQIKNHPTCIKQMLRTMENTIISEPQDYEDVAKKTETPATKTSIRIWEKDIDMFVKRKETHLDNKCVLYSVVWGQCSKAMQAKVKTDKLYDDISEQIDGLALIKIIKGIAYKFESQKNLYLALDNAKKAFYIFHQGSEVSTADYMSKFKNVIEVIEHYSGDIGEDRSTIAQ